MKRRGRYSVPVSQMNVAMARERVGECSIIKYFSLNSILNPPTLSFFLWGGCVQPHQLVEENNKGGETHKKNRTRLFVKGFFFSY